MSEYRATPPTATFPRPVDGTPDQRHDQGRIGRDIWPAGRVARVLAGVLFLAAAFGTAVTFHLLSLSGLLAIAATVVVAALAYTVGIRVLADRFLVRADPWLAALALVLPLAVVAVLPFLPPAIPVGLDAFVALSLLTQAAIGYGGCEIVSIPTLVLRRRFTVYCALNGVDLVERWLEARPRWVRWTMAILAFLLTSALITLVAATVGNVGYWIAYIAFLVFGLVLNRALRARAARP